MVTPPDFSDILRARDLLAGRLPVTPMWSYPVLDAVVGATVLVKHENVQPVGAFKVRGGLTLLAGMSAADRARGLVTYSTGNHARSIAYACAAFGVSCTVVMPVTAGEAKAGPIRAMGATALLDGANLAEAQLRAERVAEDEGRRLVGCASEPALIAGVGSAYLEIFESRPDLDAVVVPVGSGTGAAAAGLVAAQLAPHCRVIGVQSSASPAAHDSWRAGTCVRRPDRTTAAGLATGQGFELTQGLLRSGLADFHLVSDDEIATARRLLATHAHTLAEGAGAAALAAVLGRPEEFAGRTVAVVCTGGNASAAEIATLAVDDRVGAA